MTHNNSTSCSNRDNNESPATTSSSKLDNTSDEDNSNNSNNHSSNGNNTPIEECVSQLGREDTTSSGIGEGGGPPALPPRPPNLSLPLAQVPHPPHAYINSRMISQQHIRNGMPASTCQYSGITGERVRDPDGPGSCLRRFFSKKYILLCGLCGGLCFSIGVLYLVIFFLLKNYTTSMHYFQTIPMYIPSVVLIVTGLLVMCFARRGNRNSYLIKVCGCCCLCSAVLCVVVTVTTTVIHMNRLQTLRECVYQGSTHTCTCFAAYMDTGHHTLHHHDPTLRFVFAGTQDCEVIHGVLYSCLRSLFGLSVIGILVCIFSCMLVYQLLSHEKKKKYWEQLEQRCRHLYRGGRPVLGSTPYVLGRAGGGPGLSSLLLGPSQLSCHTFLGSSPMTANTTMTNLSQCGYCTTDEGFHNLVLPGAGSCSSGVMGGTNSAATITTTASSTDGYGCPWPTNSVWDVIQDDRLHQQFDNTGCGNLYTPNPVEANAQAVNLMSILHSNTSSSGNEQNPNDNTSQANGPLRSSWSLGSLRNWIRWISNTPQPSQPPSENRSDTPSQNGVVQRRPQVDRSSTDPRWRHSNPDSHYGFRTTSFLQGGQLYHYQQPLYPQQQQQQQPQLQWRYEGPEGPYALPEQLPRYLWGPPPPYSQPPSLENIREASSTTSQQNLVGQGTSSTTSGPTSPTSPEERSRTNPRPPLARTTKSGLLVSSTSDFTINTSHSPNTPNIMMASYDESVKSAVHVYEQANQLRRKRYKIGKDDNALNYCNSLPSRKLKLKSDRIGLPGFKSTANLPEAILNPDPSQKLTADLLGLHSTHNTTSPTRCLTLQMGSRQQSLPLPPIPSQKAKRASDIYRPSSVVSRSSCSTTENKYETIGKSLSPYKIVPDPPMKPKPSGLTSKQQRMKMGLRSLDSSSFSSASPSGDSDHGYGFGSSSVSPMSLGTVSGGAPDIDMSKQQQVSSHYAQISPLRGEGLPPPCRMGLPTSTSTSNTNPNSPVKSYFQVIQRQGASSATSLPNVNSMMPMSSPQIFKPIPDHEDLKNKNCWQSNNNNSSQNQILSPQNLSQQFNTVHRTNNSSNHSKGLGFMKSRFYSASSEMVNSNNNNNNSNNSQNANYLSSPPPPNHYPSQLKRFSPFFAQNTVAISTHKSLENLEGLEPLTGGNFGGSPPPFSHQKRRRPLYSHNNPYSTTNKDDTGLPVTRGCVYLRPEQNIPEVFSTAFKPINENFGKGDDDLDSVRSKNSGSNQCENNPTGDQTISRDDIVVTMRSVNV